MHYYARRFARDAYLDMYVEFATWTYTQYTLTGLFFDLAEDAEESWFHRMQIELLLSVCVCGGHEIVSWGNWVRFSKGWTWVLYVGGAVGLTPST